MARRLELPQELPVKLSDEELAFFRMTCDLFPTPESPLAAVDAELAPEDVERIFAEVEKKGLLNSQRSGASPQMLDRLEAVSECSARVLVRFGGDARVTRDWYVASGTGVEYREEEDGYAFGDPRSESALAVELAQLFRTTSDVKTKKLHMSAGEYLVFAVFARDVRARPEPGPKNDDAMSIDEVLAYFDEPENKYLRTPSDDSWQQAVTSLAAREVLVKEAGGHALHPSLHALAREIVADHQHTVMRFDFLDDQWLVREVSLYPTEKTVYRLGTEADGSVVIQELSSAALADTLAGVVSTLPNLLNPDIQPMLKETSGARSI
jgi:hypothetical protein